MVIRYISCQPLEILLLPHMFYSSLICLHFNKGFLKLEKTFKTQRSSSLIGKLFFKYKMFITIQRERETVLVERKNWLESQEPGSGENLPISKFTNHQKVRLSKGLLLHHSYPTFPSEPRLSLDYYSGLRCWILIRQSGNLYLLEVERHYI